jgi:hypothetical protein
MYELPTLAATLSLPNRLLSKLLTQLDEEYDPFFFFGLFS